MADTGNECGERAETSSPDPRSSILDPRSPLLFLIGPRASGKTTVARLLAGRLGWGWRDADAVLEDRCGRSIRAALAAEGEAGFRERGTAVLAALCRARRRVVAAGLGRVLRVANRAF